nr:receptor-like protein 9DC3 [Quercus suber]
MELLRLSSVLEPREALKSFRSSDLCLLVENFYPQDFIDYDKQVLKKELYHFEHNVVQDPEFKELKSLSELSQWTLNLAGNYNFSVILSESGNFKTLTHLNLSYSMFSGQMPLEISHLSSLVLLDLSYNFGLLIETPIWNNLTQLRELLLDDTNMSLFRPNSLMNLSSSFTTLSLNDCYLQGKLENNIFHLPSIQTLDLGFNSNLDLGSLPKCNWSSSSLKFLTLFSISFLGELPESIGNLKYLKISLRQGFQENFLILWAI